MNEYMLIQAAKSKVYLLAAKSSKGVYTIKFGKRKLELTHYIESWICVSIYSMRSHLISSWLRDVFPDLLPDEVDFFFNRFKEEHPLERIEFNYDDVPLIATESQHCVMNIGVFKMPVYLTLKQEKELLEITKTNNPPRFKRYYGLVRWFERYCSKYGYEARLKRDRNVQAEILADSFCEYHGLQTSPLKISSEELALEKARQEEFEKLNLSSFWPGFMNYISAIGPGYIQVIIGMSIIWWIDYLDFWPMGLLLGIVGCMFISNGAKSIAQLFKQ